MASNVEYAGPPLVDVNPLWKTTPLEEVCDGIYDCPHSTPKLADEGFYMVRTQDIRKGFFDTSGAVCVSDESYNERIKRAEPSYGDVVLSREGTYFGDAAEVPPDTKLCLGQRMVLLRPCKKQINPTFLRIWINSKNFQNYLLAFRDGTVAERLNVSTIRKLPIPVPSLEEQAEIISLITPLEEKEALSRRMSETLEGISSALFKSWFVDFDPVIDNALAAGNPIPEEFAVRAETRRALLRQGSGGQEAAADFPTIGKNSSNVRKLFPDSFQTSELGPIPAGWDVSTFGDVASAIRDSVNPSNLDADIPYVGLEHIGRKQMYLSDWGYAGDVDSNKSAFKKGDVLFGKLRPYFHKVCVMNFAGICSTDILVFRAKEDCWSGFIQYQLFDEEFVEYANARSTGTRMPRASWKDMVAYPIAKPGRDVATRFAELVAGLNAKAMLNVESASKLARLRDTLLPKLISGELDVSHMNQILEG